MNEFQLHREDRQSHPSTPKRKERVTINNFHATFAGNHNTYQVKFESGDWHCECLFFTTRGVCSHTMALQRILDDVLETQEKSAETV